MVGVVDEPGVDQRVADERGADEAGPDAVVLLAHELGEPLAARAALGLVREQVEPQRQRVRGLGIARQPTRRGDELAVEGGDDAVGELVVAGGVLVVSEDIGGPRQEASRVGVVGGGDQRGVGPGDAGIVGRRRRVEPVAELEALVPEVILTGELGDLIDPRPHAVVLAPRGARRRRTARTAPTAR